MDGQLEDRGDGITREAMHFRRIDCKAFRRSDGLFEVRAHLTDTKPHDFAPPSDARNVPAGEAIHDLGVTLIFGRDMVITGVETFMASFPYRTCPGGGDTLQNLIGVTLGAGWNSEVRKRLPRCDTCTHLREILTPLATVAFQAMVVERQADLDAVDASGVPTRLDSCHAYGRTRALAQKLWPEHG